MLACCSTCLTTAGSMLHMLLVHLVDRCMDTSAPVLLCGHWGFGHCQLGCSRLMHKCVPAPVLNKCAASRLPSSIMLQVMSTRRSDVTLTSS